jgi:hypothetical protein
VSNAWQIGLFALVIGVSIHLGALDWFTDARISNADGSTERLPNTFASIDHPFHLAKERAVLDALRGGEFPRWITNHQAGYPSEFYPLGADLIVAAGWAVGFGLVPLEIVHKLVIIAVLFIPVACYWVIARRDRWPASVAVAASLLHLFVPGGWLGGGPDELLRMGMWPNVLASYLMLPLMLWSADYLRLNSRRGFVLAACAGSLAIYTNPRALIAVAIVLLSVGIVALARSDRGKTPRNNAAGRWTRQRQRETRQQVSSSLARRTLLLGTTIVLLCATLIVPLRARQHLYEFTRFVDFSSLAKVREYFSTAIPAEILAIAIFGVVVVARHPRFHTCVLAVWLPLSAFTIVVIGWLLRDLSLFEQLEAPRLLPLVRLPAIFLAAIGIHAVIEYLGRYLSFVSTQRAAGIATVGFVTLVALTPVSPLSASERGLPELETTDQPAFAAIERSARIFEQTASSADRPLIIGSPISEHASFWIPTRTGVNVFHAAWVWYWHTPAYADQTRVANLASTLDLEFLNRNGLTFVLISTDSREMLGLARSKPWLRAIDDGADGGYAIFRVEDDDPSTLGPVSITSGQVTSLDASHEHLTADLHTNQATRAVIAINDYPAWRATINGQPVPISRSADGYMEVDIPAGDVRLELSYAVEPVVWYGRVLTTVGLILLFAVALRPLRHRPEAM